MENHMDLWVPQVCQSTLTYLLRLGLTHAQYPGEDGKAIRLHRRLHHGLSPASQHLLLLLLGPCAAGKAVLDVADVDKAHFLHQTCHLGNVDLGTAHLLAAVKDEACVGAEASIWLVAAVLGVPGVGAALL